MATRERRLSRARWRARRSLVEIGEELREARLSTGMSQTDIGMLSELSRAEISRIERGVAGHVAYETLVVIAACVGLDLPLRAYPNGDRPRDRAHLALFARFRALLPPGLRHRTEVPLGIPGDRRAWDEVLDGPGWSIPVEAETRLRDTQALRRRLALKCQDAGVDRMILVVADTRQNRHVLRLAAAEFAEAFPVKSHDAVGALRKSERPTGGAIVVV